MYGDAIKGIMYLLVVLAVLCVDPSGENEKNYRNGFVYNVRFFKHFQIINDPIYRAFETIEEFLEATKDRKDFRVISKDGKHIMSLTSIEVRSDKQIWFLGSSSDYIHNNYVWLDDRTIIGIERGF